MVQTALIILTHVNGLTSIEQEPNLPDEFRAEYINICCMAYYTGHDNNRTGN